MQFVDYSGQEGTNVLLRLNPGNGGVHLRLDEATHVVRLG